MLPRRPQWLTFDCYGTLIDWEQGIRQFFATIPGVRDPAILVESWEEIQFRMIAGGYRPYRAILAESLRETLAQHRIPPSPGKEAEFAESLPSWPPFSDTNTALEKLQAAGFKLGIISNIDDDLLARTVRRFTVSFDLLITAQQSGAYKPAANSFELALGRTGTKPEEVCHVAFGERYDLATARAQGMMVAFVRRHGRSIAFRSDLEVGSLAELAEAIT